MHEILHINFHDYVAFWHSHDSIRMIALEFKIGNMIRCNVNVIASSKQRITFVL